MNRFIAICLLLVSHTLWALDLELTQGINAALPIGIGTFTGDYQGQALVMVVKNDLSISGQFRVITSPAQALQAQESISLWRQAGADSVLTGQVESIGANRYKISYKLVDAAAQGRLLLAKDYIIYGQEMRALAHHISDEVYEKLTGDRGIFSTRIAYILVQRNAGHERFSLEVADVDGNSPHSLLVSSEPIMSPTWSPDGRQIAYVSFERKKAQIYTVSVETGQRRLITDFSGINGAPSWSPDGKRMAVVLSKGGSPKLYIIEMATGRLTQLTFGDAIDTEPRFSPDGRSILFTSGRGGTPQIYQISLADGKINRVTYEGNYNARASFTPNQKNLVMLHRENSQFNIGVQDMDTGQVLPVTFSQLDESPSVSPNGRLILYATQFEGKGILAMVSIDGRIRMRLPARAGDIQEPAWSPFLG